MITEHSVQASDRVKVADVAWASEEFIQRNGDARPYQEAPEICIEIVSLSNSPEEMAQKIELYPAKGAHEVWVCGEEGDVSYYAHRGRIEQSSLLGSPVRLGGDRKDQ